MTPTAKVAVEIGGCATEAFLAAYADRLLVMMTQTGTCGSILHVKTVARGDGTFDVATRPLLGRRDAQEMFVCAKRLAMMLRTQRHDSRPILLCLALRRLHPDHIQRIVHTSQILYDTLPETND